MASAKKEQYKGIFVYTDEILRDFEAMYRMKTSVSPVTRLVMGLIGAAGTVVFLVLMVLKGFSVSFLLLAAGFALLLLLALLGGITPRAVVADPSAARTVPCDPLNTKLPSL